MNVLIKTIYVNPGRVMCHGSVMLIGALVTVVILQSPTAAF